MEILTGHPSANHTHTLLIPFGLCQIARFTFNKEKHHAAFLCSFHPHDGFGLGIRPCRFHA